METLATFDIENYLELNTEPNSAQKALTTKIGSLNAKLLDSQTEKKILYYIEELHKRNIDITENYHTWLNIGFAFASLGEKGRVYYHKVSQLSEKYNTEETEKKFNNLLANFKGEISIGTFLYLCQQIIPDNRIDLEPSPVMESNLEKIYSVNQYLKQHIGKPVVFSNPIISRNERGIIYPNTINVIQGKSGVHKSRLVETFCSCLLNRELGRDFLGYKTSSLQQYSVLYVDTERNYKDQYLYALQQIKKKAGFGIETELPNFDFISLIEIPREARFDTLKNYLEEFRSRFSTHIFIVLDVITDCLLNFNDPKESMKLTDLLNVMINRYDVTFLCVIHENPGSGEKARGHLGTEIMNKTSCQIQIGFEKDRNQNDTELIKVKYLKVRVGKNPEPLYLMYSEVEKGLVLADVELLQTVSENRKEKAGINNVKKFLSKTLLEPTERKLLLEHLMQEFDCSKNTAIDRLKTIMDNSELILDINGQNCYLKAVTEKGKSLYFLESENSLD